MTDHIAAAVRAWELGDTEVAYLELQAALIDAPNTFASLVIAAKLPREMMRMVVIGGRAGHLRVSVQRLPS